MVMVKMTHHNTILSSNVHGRMVKINRYFKKFQQFKQQKIWNCSYGHDRIWIDHFDHDYLQFA
jgi:hypothetical protein